MLAAILILLSVHTQISLEIQSKGILEGSQQSQILPQCNVNVCSKPTQVTVPSKIKSTVQMNKVTMELTIYPEEEEIIYFKRKRYTRHTFTMRPGGWDIETMESIPSDIDTVREWGRKGQCFVGCTCERAQECWGKDADCCTDHSTRIPLGLGDEIQKEEKLEVPFRQSCISKWQCVLKILRLKVYLEMKKGKIIRSTKDHDMNTLTMNDAFYRKGTKKEKDVYYYPMNESPTPKVSTTEGTCYSNDVNSIQCRVKVEGKLNGVSIEISPSTLTGFYRGTFVRVTSPITTVKEGQIYTLRPGSFETHFRSILERDDSLRAASEEEIKEVIDSLRLVQMQSLYNTLVISDEMWRIIEILTKTIKWLSKRDPYLISKISGGHFKTKWLNDDVFIQCPCEKPPIVPNTSNCEGSYIYDEGVFRKNPSLEECHTYEESLLSNTTILDLNVTVDQGTLDFSDIQSASSTDSSWDWLVQQRHNEISYKHRTDNTPSMPEYAGVGNIWSIWYQIKDIFIILTCCLWWASILIPLIRPK